MREPARKSRFGTPGCVAGAGKPAASAPARFWKESVVCTRPRTEQALRAGRLPDAAPQGRSSEGVALALAARLVRVHLKDSDLMMNFDGEAPSPTLTIEEEPPDVPAK